MGKLKLNKKVVINNYQRKNILVFFSDKKNDLFECDLEENEIYFNIACGYNKMIEPSSYKMDYLNCSDSYFFINAPKKHDYFQPCLESLYLRILDLQNVIKEILDDENVIQITYYHTDSGNENSIDEYELVDWNIDYFAAKFFVEIIMNKGFTPTIKVVFNKNDNH